MKTLDCIELNNINGGSKTLWLGISAAVLFLIGLVDGIINPQKCRNKK